jgi:hypothetical protein
MKNTLYQTPSVLWPLTPLDETAQARFAHRAVHEKA